jgi:hypothetical protein
MRLHDAPARPSDLAADRSAAGTLLVALFASLAPVAAVLALSTPVLATAFTVGAATGGLLGAAHRRFRGSNRGTRRFVLRVPLTDVTVRV